MAGDNKRLDGLSDAERALAEHLNALGPLMRDQERAEVEIRRDFARHLRNHLVHGEEVAPHPTFARNLRRRLVSVTGEPTGNRRSQTRWIGGAIAAMLAAAVASITLFLLLPRQPAFHVPSPARADLIFSFPVPSTVIRELTPTRSLVHPAAGVPFGGRLALETNALPIEPPQLRAYTLARMGNAAARGRQILRIDAPLARVVVGNTTWQVAADGGPGTARPLHSIAVSLASGELIYHDRRNALLPRSRHPLGRRASVTTARDWLEKLGWPARAMPLRSISPVGAMPDVRQVVLGWPGVGPAATEAATLWVTPRRSVIEAWVWPPVARSGIIAASPVSRVWASVRNHAVPLAVKGVFRDSGAMGTGLLRRVSIVPVLVRAGRNTYLVPTYRFEGIAHLRGAARAYIWYSLAPGAQK